MKRRLAAALTCALALGATGCGDDPCDRHCAALEKADCPADEENISECDSACDFGRDFLASCGDQYDALLNCQGGETFVCDEAGNGHPPPGACQEESDEFSRCFLRGGGE